MLSKHIDKLKWIVPERISGQVDRVVGLTAECVGLPVPVGSLCELHAGQNGKSMLGEVVGFANQRSYLMPYTDVSGAWGLGLLCFTLADGSGRGGASGADNRWACAAN